MHKLRSQKNTGQIRNITEIIVRESYDCGLGNSLDNDIALLRLDAPLGFSQNVQPTAIATGGCQ